MVCISIKCDFVLQFPDPWIWKFELNTNTVSSWHFPNVMCIGNSLACSFAIELLYHSYYNEVQQKELITQKVRTHEKLSQMWQQKKWSNQLVNTYRFHYPYTSWVFLEFFNKYVIFRLKYCKVKHHLAS